jgi:hypothetical protein
MDRERDSSFGIVAKLSKLVEVIPKFFSFRVTKFGRLNALGPK